MVSIINQSVLVCIRILSVLENALFLIKFENERWKLVGRTWEKDKEFV